MHKTAAVIGAGPAGLAAAKELIDVGIETTIFDESSCVGGIWSPVSKACRQTMRTNLSKFTCSHSALASFLGLLV